MNTVATEASDIPQKTQIRSHSLQIYISSLDWASFVFNKKRGPVLHGPAAISNTHHYSTWQELCCVLLSLILDLSKYSCLHIKKAAVTNWMRVCVCVCVCSRVSEWEWERERKGRREGGHVGFNCQSKTSCTNLVWSVVPPHHLTGCEVLVAVIKDTDLKRAFCLLTDYYSLGSCEWDHWVVRPYSRDASLKIKK